MVSDTFDFKPVKNIPGRSYTKKSKYDPIVDKFLESKDNIWQVNIDGVNANYLRTQLHKRIKKRYLTDKIEVSVVNEILYIQKKN